MSVPRVGQGRTAAPGFCSLPCLQSTFDVKSKENVLFETYIIELLKIVQAARSSNLRLSRSCRLPAYWVCGQLGSAPKRYTTITESSRTALCAAKIKVLNRIFSGASYFWNYFFNLLRK